MYQVAERIKELRELMGISQETFVQRLAVTRSHISKVETGAVTPSNQLIRSICREYEVREKWLREGKGQIEKKPIAKEEIEEFRRNLERTAYSFDTRRLNLAYSAVQTAVNLLKDFKRFNARPNNPEAAEFLKARRRFQRSVKELQKIMSRKNQTSDLESS